MALQHFYSRVPARVSMFNRTDGPDTFACSEGITQEFAQKELGIVCDQKLTQSDNEAIREGRVPPVYCRFLTKTGVAVQSCISYLPTDYTGERTSYMVHSLIFPREEEEKLLREADGGILEPAVFQTSLSGFSLTDSGARPDSSYPPVGYCPVYTESPAWFAEQYDPATVKRFLFGLLLALCGKIRSVYVVMDPADSRDDAWMHRLIEAVYHILPHYLRRQLTFATRVWNTTQYPTVRLKGITLAADSMQTVKSVVVDFAKKTVLGIREEELSANRECVEHFYAMLTDAELCRRYFGFSLHVVDAQESAGECSLKRISENVFLFRAGCGLYEEKTVLATDERVLDLMTLYDGAREALPIDYRVHMMHAMERYPMGHREIPKKVFAKITKLYPTEPQETRTVLMAVVLELIHTDAMREKLFQFIRNQFESEKPDTQTNVLLHLCGVFYGGFLQTQLLTFFGKYYRYSAQDAKDAILDKVLLAIRTRALRTSLLAFFDTVYPDMNETSRGMLYLTILEQLPEGDDLALSLIGFVDRHLPGEPEAVRKDFTERLFALLEAEQRRAAHPLLSLFDNPDTFCGRAVAVQVLNVWNTRKIFDEYVSVLMRGGLVARIGMVKKLCALIPGTDKSKSQHLSDAVAQAFLQPGVQADLGQLLDAETTAQTDTDPLVGRMVSRALSPLIARSLTDVFRMGRTPEQRKPDRTVESLLAYGKDNSVLHESKQYGVLRVYALFKEATVAGDVNRMIDLCAALPQEPRKREEIGAYATADTEFRPGNADAAVALTLLCSYLKTGGYRADICYQTYARGGKGKASEMDADFGVVGQIFAVLYRIYTAASASEEMKKALTDSSCGLREITGSLTDAYGKKAVRYLEQTMDEFADDGGHFTLYCRSLLREEQTHGGFFQRLFGKKRS